MTIIVGVLKNNQLCIAADTLTSYGSQKFSSKHIRDHNKICKIGDSYLGLAGWQAIANIVEHLSQVKPSFFRLGSRQEIFESLLNLQAELKENYFIDTNENNNQPVESNHISAIIINKSGLFEIGSYREVTQYNDFCAIGSGKGFALGAMNAVYEKSFTAEEIAYEGVKAASEFDIRCSLPHTWHTFDL